jgi:DNA-binding HxlR family transcriptional regulator
MRLVADGRLVWIMRELAERPLRVVDLGDRIGCIPHTTLIEKLDLLTRAGVTRREERGGRASGVVQHLRGVGRALLDLADQALASSLRADPRALQLVFGSPSGAPALRILADDAGATLLSALAGSPQPLASLERSLRPLTRSQLKTRLHALELAGFSRREDDLHVLSDAGRKAGGLLAVAARIEQRHSLPGAVAARPEHMVTLLSVGVPLVPASNDGETVVELVVEAESQCRDDDACRCWAVSHGSQTRIEQAPPEPAQTSAIARGPLRAWCSALIDGRLAALRFVGKAELAHELARGLHLRLFPDGANRHLET